MSSDQSCEILRKYMQRLLHVRWRMLMEFGWTSLGCLLELHMVFLVRVIALLQFWLPARERREKESERVREGRATEDSATKLNGPGSTVP